MNPFRDVAVAIYTTEQYELSKSGKLLFNHPQGTYDDRFWATALAVYSITEKKANKPVAKR